MTRLAFRSHCLPSLPLLVVSALCWGGPALAELPPPPPDPGFTFEPANSPPASAPAATSNKARYRVRVPGSGDSLLWQVRSVVPGAFVRDGAIQAGLFSESENALELVRDLADLGVWAQIVPLNGAPPVDVTASAAPDPEATVTPPGQLPAPPPIAQPDPSPTSAALPANVPLGDSPDEGETARAEVVKVYYVTVAGRPHELPELAEATRAAGAFDCSVQERQLEGETVVAVGPFESKRIARAWRNRLEDVGLDADIEKTRIER